MEQTVLWDSLALQISSSKAGIIWPHLLSNVDQTHPDSDKTSKLGSPSKCSSGPSFLYGCLGAASIPELKFRLGVLALGHSWIQKHTALGASHLPPPHQC